MNHDFLRMYRSKKLDRRKLISGFLMDHGVAHIACRVSSRDDLLEPFSMPGYEILSGSFSAYLEKLIPYISPKVPVLLQIYGFEPDEKDRQTICRAIRTYFQLKGSRSQRETGCNLLRIIWFTVCMLIVCCMLFLTHDTTQNQIVLNLVFVLFYFFGDRLTSFVLLDSRTIRDQRARYIQMASMQILFSGMEPVDSLTPEQAERCGREVIENAGRLG